MRIEKRVLQDVADCITALLTSGCKRIVVNLAEVQYIDSSGLAVIVHVYATSARLGVPLYCSHPSARLHDLLQLTKLATIFVVKSSSWPSVPEGGEADVECEILRAPTYDDEYVRLVIGTTQTITVEGQLDLFASEVVTRIWHLVPPPRRVVFEVAQSQYTEAGLQPLLDLCAIADESNRSAIVITGVTDQSRDSLPRHPAVHERSSDAESALHLSGRRLPTLHLRVRQA